MSSLCVAICGILCLTLPRTSHRRLGTSRLWQRTSSLPPDNSSSLSIWQILPIPPLTLSCPTRALSRPRLEGCPFWQTRCDVRGSTAHTFRVSQACVHTPSCVHMRMLGRLGDWEGRQRQPRRYIAHHVRPLAVCLPFCLALSSPSSLITPCCTLQKVSRAVMDASVHLPQETDR